MKNIHEQFTDFDQVSGPSNKSFGLTFAFALAVLAALGKYKYNFSYDAVSGCTSVATAFLLLSLINADSLKIYNRCWTLLGKVLHKIATPLIMLLIYTLVFVPMGIILRLSGKNSMLVYKDGATSFWINKPKSELPDPMKYQF